MSAIVHVGISNGIALKSANKPQAKGYAMDWMRKVNELSKCLEGLIVRDEAGNEIEPDEGFKLWVERTLEI